MELSLEVIKMKTSEEIPVYVKSKELFWDIYKLDNKKYLRDFGFKDQIQRAAVFVLSNIAE